MIDMTTTWLDRLADPDTRTAVIDRLLEEEPVEVISNLMWWVGCTYDRLCAASRLADSHLNGGDGSGAFWEGVRAVTDPNVVTFPSTGDDPF